MLTLRSSAAPINRLRLFSLLGVTFCRIILCHTLNVFTCIPLTLAHIHITRSWITGVEQLSRPNWMLLFPYDRSNWCQPSQLTPPQCLILIPLQSRDEATRIQPITKTAVEFEPSRWAVRVTKHPRSFNSYNRVRLLPTGHIQQHLRRLNIKTGRAHIARIQATGYRGTTRDVLDSRQHVEPGIGRIRFHGFIYVRKRYWRK